MYKAELVTVANNIDTRICEVLSKGKSFRVEAGAGSGKTFSLMKVIEWLENNKISDYKKRGCKIACLTFTNAAVDVIKSRLKTESCILPMTIHSFAWSVMKQFQNAIIAFLAGTGGLPEGTERDSVEKVTYTLGKKYFEEETSTLYLGHNDILTLFSSLLDKEKFRLVLSKNYPLVLIDEYQDSNKDIISKFTTYFISQNRGIQFGFFGDSWQTIYQSNNACGLIENVNLTVINKEVNFRSTAKIVDVLNKIRPDLPQTSALIDDQSVIKVITTDNFTGDRRYDRNFKTDLPPSVIEEYIKRIKQKLNTSNIYDKELKVLMLTHRILADQQGYSNLFDMLDDGLKNANDDLLCYVRDFIEPLKSAINTKNMLEICEILKTRNLLAIEKKSDKSKWLQIYNSIQDVENTTIFNVLKILKEQLPIEFPVSIANIFSKMEENSTEVYQQTTYRELKNILYSEFLKASLFISTESQYSTDHGVKGEEYDSVLFVIGRGWSLYQFDKYMPLTIDDITDNNRKSYERNRNLFYVCCSRAKKNLFLLITIPLEQSFKAYLEMLVGKENVVSYESYIEAN